LIALSLRNLSHVSRVRLRDKWTIVSISMFISLLFFNIKWIFSSQLSNAGVNYYTRYRRSSTITWQIYVNKFKDFHQCPMVKMCYHFVSVTNSSFYSFWYSTRITAWLHLATTSVQLYDIVQVGSAKRYRPYLPLDRIIHYNHHFHNVDRRHPKGTNIKSFNIDITLCYSTYFII